MTNFVEPSAGTYRVARELSQKPDFSHGDGGEPIRVAWSPAIDYEDMGEYIRSWPDKLVRFVCDRLADDDMRPFTRALYEYICQADADGPAYEAWRET